MVLLAVVGVVVIRWMWQPDSDSYASVRDSAGSAKGQAGRLTEALRSHGLTCSDQYLDDRAGYSRGCYRTDFEHDVEVEFAGPPDSTLGRVSISVDYIGADDEENAHGDFDALVGDVVRTAALGSADAAAVTKHLAAGTDQKFSMGWGTAELVRATKSTSTIRLLHNGWTPALVAPDALSGSLEALTRSAVQRGYSCQPDVFSTVVTCRKKADGAELSLTATQFGDTTRIGRLYVSADTGLKDRAMTLALAEQAAALDTLGGPRAATAKVWFGDNAGVAGGRAYVVGMHAYIKVVDKRALHSVQLELTAAANQLIRREARNLAARLWRNGNH